jgi:hypothetical protein
MFGMTNTDIAKGYWHRPRNGGRWLGRSAGWGDVSVTLKQFVTGMRWAGIAILIAIQAMHQAIPDTGSHAPQVSDLRADEHQHTRKSDRVYAGNGRHHNSKAINCRGRLDVAVQHVHQLIQLTGIQLPNVLYGRGSETPVRLILDERPGARGHPAEDSAKSLIQL